MAGKHAPRRQSGHVNAGARVRYRVAKSAGPPPGLPHARLGGQGAVLPRCPVGMAAFVERARRELRAAGEIARPRTAPAARATGSSALTAQEARVARLARDGLSNPEIGARLFISASTAKYHLSNVFTKLAISSRSQLERVLPAGRDPAAPR
jgi:DNA-binding CsgD family transcriptional regulator